MPQPSISPAAELNPAMLDRAPLDSAVLNSAIAHIIHLAQTQQLAAAQQHCQQLLATHPNCAPGWHALGMIALQQGQLAAAQARFQQAIALSPSTAEFHDHLGVVYCKRNQFTSGIQSYRTALELNPTAIETRYNLAIALQKHQEPTEALAIFLTLPHYPPAQYQAGNLYYQQGQWMNAIAHYQRAIELHPGFGDAWCHLAITWQALGEINRAEHGYQQALRLNPNSAKAQNGMGAILEFRGKTAAIAHFERAIALQPDYLPALLNLAHVRVLEERFVEAEILYLDILQRSPEQVTAMDALIAIYLKTCTWDKLNPISHQLKSLAQQRLRQNLSPGISPIHTLQLPWSALEQKQIAESYAGAIVQKVQSFQSEIAQIRSNNPSTSNSRTNAKIRLGYVSGDFRYHVVGHLILSLFELHDRHQFEIYAYSLNPAGDSEEQAKFQADCDCFRSIRDLNPIDCARQIATDQIDILIDLAGYTSYARPEIFALRPAPIQVNYLGYPGTSGADYMDYLITDPVVTPPEFTPYFTETLLPLPGCYQLNSHQALHHLDAVQPISPSFQDISQDTITFACLNQSQKLDPQIFAVWMNILKRVPNSQLWLLKDCDITEVNLRSQAITHGINGDRLQFLPRISRTEHLQRLTQVDLFLDTLHYNAHVTASDALWMAVPVITLAGNTFASRVAASLLTHIEMPELITQSLEAYENLAVDLATHAEKRRSLQLKLQENRGRSPLFNTAQTVKNLEAAYQQIWQRFLGQ